MIVDFAYGGEGNRTPVHLIYKYKNPTPSKYKIR